MISTLVSPMSLRTVSLLRTPARNSRGSCRKHSVRATEAEHRVLFIWLVTLTTARLAYSFDLKSERRTMTRFGKTRHPASRSLQSDDQRKIHARIKTFHHLADFVLQLRFLIANSSSARGWTPIIRLMINSRAQVPRLRSADRRSRKLGPGYDVHHHFQRQIRHRFYAGAFPLNSSNSA